MRRFCIPIMHSPLCIVHCALYLTVFTFNRIISTILPSVRPPRRKRLLNSVLNFTINLTN